MANQFTSGGGSKGPKKGHDESTKDKIRAEVLAQRLFKFAKSKGDRREKLDMTTAQVQAAKVLIDRGKPTLQAVQQTTKEELPSNEEMLSQLHSLLANPETRHALRSILGTLPDAVNEAVAGQPDNESVVTKQQSAA